MLKIKDTAIGGLKIIESQAFQDDRGAFFRAFCKDILAQHGINFDLCQTNVSINPHKQTMRGFHYQKEPTSEAKILTCLTGEIYNVVIDLRPESKTYLKHQAFHIDAQSHQSLLVPAGCANAFLTMQNDTIIYYLMDAYFSPDNYTGFRYDDPFFNISWPKAAKIISDKDRNFQAFKEDNSS